MYITQCICHTFNTPVFLYVINTCITGVAQLVMYNIRYNITYVSILDVRPLCYHLAQGIIIK